MMQRWKNLKAWLRQQLVTRKVNKRAKQGSVRIFFEKSDLRPRWLWGNMTFEDLFPLIEYFYLNGWIAYLYEAPHQPHLMLERHPSPHDDNGIDQWMKLVRFLDEMKAGQPGGPTSVPILVLSNQVDRVVYPLFSAMAIGTYKFRDQFIYVRLDANGISLVFRPMSDA